MPVIHSATDNGVDVVTINNRSIVVIDVDPDLLALGRHPSRVGRLGIIRVRRVDITNSNDIAVVECSSAIARPLATAADQRKLWTFIRRLGTNH